MVYLAGAPISGAHFQITATVGVKEDGSAKEMLIHMVQVLDYWPATPAYHRNGLKQAVTPETVSLNPGESVQVVRTFIFDAESWADQDNIKIICWAQDPAASAPAEVYQAAILTWPF